MTAHQAWMAEDRQSYIDNGLSAPTYAFNTINQQTFQILLAEYPKAVPEKLGELEKQRLEVIPISLQDRGQDPWLTKNELATLMDWKLSHGKFRPTLKGLIRQNTEEFVKETSRKAFIIYSGDKAKGREAVEVMSALKGVGPATASLLLSVYDLAGVPFFSDELFRWAFFEAGKIGHGWDRNLKYSLKEYTELWERINSFRRRVFKQSGNEPGCLDIEKVAFVLGKTTQNANADVTKVLGIEKKATNANTKRKVVDDEEDEEPTVSQNAPKRSKKTTPVTDVPAEMTRRSTRSRT